MASSPASGFIQSLQAQRDQLFADLRRAPSGLDWSYRYGAFLDQILVSIYGSCVEFRDVPLALVATGGYGRREMSPHSDLDLCLVPIHEGDPELEGVIRRLFGSVYKTLREGLGIQVGYSMRLPADAPGLDAKSRTALLDARLVAGDPEPYHALLERLLETLPVAEFLISKITEREEAMARTNDTPLATEPDLKEGAGGLRCFHTANWLGSAIGARAQRPHRPFDRVLRARNLLHLIAEKQLDHLRLDRRREVAEILGKEPGDFGAQLAEALTALHDHYRQAKDELHEARYPLAKGVVAMRGEVRVEADAEAGEAAWGIALASDLGLRVPEVKVAPKPESGPVALLALGRGEATLRALDRSGVLKALLPELDATRNYMPRDAAHAYTVFEHTLRVVRALEHAHEHPFLSELILPLRDVSLLHLAALLHDVCKLQDEPRHALLGAQVAREVGARWRLSPDLIDTVAWLVREHLTMERTMRLRDVARPDTIREFAETVGSRERLAMLTILTWADVTAVGPGIWSPLQDALLQELYWRTDAFLSAATGDGDVTEFDLGEIRRLRLSEASSEEVARYLEAMPPDYLLAVDQELARRHHALYLEARSGEPGVRVIDPAGLGATEISVAAMDASGLLSRILGVFYAYDLSLESFRAWTSRDELPVALDVFLTTYGTRPVPPATAQSVAHALREVVTGRRPVEKLLRARGKDPELRQTEFEYEYIEVPGHPGILEIQAPRGRGMAYRFSKLFSELGWSIVGARVGQYAGNASAAFYLVASGGKGPSESDVRRAL